jgi:hypothetical protein
VECKYDRNDQPDPIYPKIVDHMKQKIKILYEWEAKETNHIKVTGIFFINVADLNKEAVNSYFRFNGHVEIYSTRFRKFESVKVCDQMK